MRERSERPPVFPYAACWEEIGDDDVQFEDLEHRREDFRTLSEINVSLNLGVLHINRERLTTLAASLELGPEQAIRLIDRLELVVGWYLAPQQRRALGQDIRSVRELLSKAAKDAQRLLQSLGKIDPRTAAVLYFMLPLEADALLPNNPLDIDQLVLQVHDLTLVANRAATDIPISDGRPAEYVRNSALMLAIQAVEEAIGGPVGISRGTRANPEPHFKNADGRLIKELFADLGLIQESILAQTAERLRRTKKV